LKGRRIGLLTYQNSLAIYFKGLLAHRYGLAMTDVTWVTMRDERIATPLPAVIKIERAEPGKSMEELLLEGQIDALVEPEIPQSWLNGSGKVKRLFPDYETAEREYFSDTRIFPIMHPLVVRKEILDRDPWVANSLYDAFSKSQDLHFESIRQPHRVSYVWPRLEEEKAFFGKSPFSQGFSKNQYDVDIMIRLAQEQGLLARSLTAAELFATNTLRT
jgi:4,5-dihydroxyphthalate decarboxylase